MSAFLIVEDEPIVAAALCAFLRPHGACVVADSLAGARERLDERRDWLGFVVDVGLPDGSGLDFLAQARNVAPSVLSVVMSGLVDRDAINRAAALGARFLCKPCGPPELSWFAEEATVRPARVDATVTRAVDRARSRWKLSPREADIVGSVIRRESRDDYLEATGISINTFKTHVRNVLAKTDYDSLASLVIDLLAEG